MKNIAAASLLALLGVATQAHAHELWVLGKNGSALQADIHYGHNFSEPELIAPERLSIFEPIKVVGKNYQEVLTQKGENYHYEGKKLDKGTYLLLAQYKPTTWLTLADGKSAIGKTRKDAADAKRCLLATMTGKSILAVNGGGDDDFVGSPVTKEMEFIPLVKPSEIKQGVAVKFRLVRDGKPMKTAQVFGSYAGFAKDSENTGAFYARTDLNGEFEFKAPVKGQWFVKSTVDGESGNADCENRRDKASLSFMVY